MSSRNRVTTSIRVPEADLWLVDTTMSILGYNNRGDAMFSGYLAFLEANHIDNPMIRAAIEYHQAGFQRAQSKAA